MWQVVRKAIAILYEVSSYEKGQGKSVWRSKTLWVNSIALITLLGSKYMGFEISAEDQLAILGVVNIALRLISKDEVGFIERETN